MKCTERMSKKRVSYLFSFAAAGVLAAALAGCGSSSSGDAPAVAAAPPAGGGAAVVAPGAPAAAAVPTGTAPVTVTALTATAFAALTPVAAVGGVTIASPPVVTFSLADGATTNNPIVGWGLTTQNSTATVASQAFLRFSLAKLVPGTSGSPSKWVNYIVTTMPTYKSATDKTIVASAPRTPTTDSEGTLVDNKNGTYTYTFARDITKMKDTVAAMTVASPNVLADLGDLTYDPTLTHRLTIQISGNARGTGSNTADGSNSGVTAVPMANPINVIYDFIPATGKKVTATDTQREVVVKAVCNECHEKLTLHGSRNETQYCVVCHNDQLKYGSANVASVADATSKVPAFAIKETATVNATTGITSYSYSPRLMVADGVTIGDFPVMVHRIHNGGSLVKDGYNLANVVFDNKGFSMLGNGQRMCIKCHDSAQAAQADNFNTKPSRLACGAWHDGIKWSDGTGSTLGDKATYTAAKTQKATGTGTAATTTLAASGHVGKAQSSDATCALCHASADIKVYHRTENVTKHNPTVKPGLVSFTYDIKSAAVDSTTNDLTVVFKVSQATAGADGTLGAATNSTFKAAAAAMANPLTGFTGGPSFLLAYATSATATDGIAAPIDFNNTGVASAQAISVSLANLLDSNRTATVGSLSAQAADGYYTATIKGAAPGTKFFPVGAKLRTVGLQGYFTQDAGTNGITTATGRHSISSVKTVTGDTARRIVVDQAKCANCHEWFEGHGGNRVANTEICTMCHVPGLATSGRGIPDATLAPFTWTADQYKIVKEWKTLFGFDQSTLDAALKLPVTTNNFKDMIHGVHAGRERVTPFVDARDSTSRGEVTMLDFRRMDFPGKLNNCTTCHVAGTFSNVSASALGSTYESINAAYAATANVANAKASLATINSTDKVTSPFAASCISCHDSVAAQSHVAKNGGAIMVTRATFATNNTTAGGGEACVTCHGTGKSEDIAVKHAK